MNTPIEKITEQRIQLDRIDERQLNLDFINELAEKRGIGTYYVRLYNSHGQGSYEYTQLDVVKIKTGVLGYINNLTIFDFPGRTVTHIKKVEWIF